MNQNIEVSFDGKILDYRKGYSPAFVKSVINKNNLNGMRVFSVLKEERLESLEFLRDFNFLKSLNITCVDDHDYNFLNVFNELEELIIAMGGKKEIDFKSLTSLKKVVLEWRRNKIHGLEFCSKLEYLALIEFSEKDFSLLNSVPNLKTLRVKTAKIKSTYGLESIPLLEELLLANCSSLEIIKFVGKHKNLKVLHLEMCKKIADFYALGELPELEKFIIKDCGDIPSLDFLKGMPSLKEFRVIGKTKIGDCDLSYVKNINTVVLP